MYLVCVYLSGANAYKAVGAGAVVAANKYVASLLFIPIPASKFSLLPHSLSPSPLKEQWPRVESI
jgi:hypothetical protein